MEQISIKNTTVGIFSTNVKKVATKHTNPFGISFKGNVLQADVFDGSKVKDTNKSDVFVKLTDKTKAFKSAIVGGINTFNTKLSTRFNNGINKVVSFGKKIVKDTKEFWKIANEKTFVLDFGKLSEGFKDFSKVKEVKKDIYEVDELVKRPVSELETMLNKELEVIKG